MDSFRRDILHFESQHGVRATGLRRHFNRLLRGGAKRKRDDAALDDPYPKRRRDDDGNATESPSEYAKRINAWTRRQARRLAHEEQEEVVETCLICTAPLTALPPEAETEEPDVVTLPCGHKFHRQCVCNWMSTMLPVYENSTDVMKKFINTCPSCRQTLENEEKRYEICPRLQELDNNASASRRVLPDTSFDDDDDDEETDYESSDDDDDDLDVSDWVTSVVFSPDGQYLASGTRDNTVKLWRVSESGSIQIVRTIRGHNSWVTSVVFSPDGQYLASGSYDRTMKLWRVDTGELVRTMQGHTAGLSSVAFSPDGQYLASASWDRTVKLWCVETGELRRVLEGNSSYIHSVAFSPLILNEGLTLAWGDSNRGRGGNLKLWAVETSRDHPNNVESSEYTTIEAGHDGYVLSVAFSPNGEYIASGGVGNDVKLWRHFSETGELVNTFRHRYAVTSIAFSPQSVSRSPQYLVTGSRDNTVKLWRVDTGNVVRTITGHTHWVTSVDISPDGRYIASGSGDGTVKLWEI